MSLAVDLGAIDATLETICDLHDKISDAIHGITRSHFLHSAKPSLSEPGGPTDRSAGDGKGGYVFVKGFGAVDDGVALAIAEARSLDSIRSALENLEEKLEFFHTVQLQQRAERDAAIAGLEQSRIILARRLADHPGRKYEVIEEAIAFVGNFHDKDRFVSPAALYEVSRSRLGESLEDQNGKRTVALLQMLISGMNFAKQSFRLDRLGGVLGNGAMFAVSLLTLLQLHQVAFVNGTSQMRDQTFYRKVHLKNNLLFRNPPGVSSQANYLDVLSARG